MVNDPIECDLIGMPLFSSLPASLCPSCSLSTSGISSPRSEVLTVAMEPLRREVRFRFFVVCFVPELRRRRGDTFFTLVTRLSSMRNDGTLMLLMRWLTGGRRSGCQLLDTVVVFVSELDRLAVPPLGVQLELLDCDVVTLLSRRRRSRGSG